MDISAIDRLRAQAKQGNLYWKDGSTIMRVKYVPANEQDPDDTGVTDYIAILDSPKQPSAHVDLSGVGEDEFFILVPFATEMVEQEVTEPETV